jgi:hypothetical protein
MNRNLLKIVIFLFSIIYPVFVFSSCFTSMDELLTGKSVVLVEIVKLQDPEKVKQVTKMKKSNNWVDISIPAEIKVLKVYKGSHKLADVQLATVQMTCLGEKYTGVSTGLIHNCLNLNKESNYPFIEGQRYLLFNSYNLSDRFTISAGQACGYDLSWCVKSDKGLNECPSLESLENRFRNYWEK